MAKENTIKSNGSTSVDLSKPLVFSEDNKKHYFVNAEGLTPDQINALKDNDRVTVVTNQEAFLNEMNRTGKQERDLKTHQKGNLGGSTINVKGKKAKWEGNLVINPNETDKPTRVATTLGELDPVDKGSVSIRENYWSNRPFTTSKTGDMVIKGMVDYVLNSPDNRDTNSFTGTDSKTNSAGSGVYNIGGGKKFGISKAELDYEDLKDKNWVDVNDNSNYNWTPEEISNAEAMDVMFMPGGEKKSRVVKDRNVHGGKNWISKTDKYLVTSPAKYKSLYTIAKDIYGEIPEKIAIDNVSRQAWSLMDSLRLFNPNLINEVRREPKNGYWSEYDVTKDPKVVDEANKIKKETVEKQFTQPKAAAQGYLDEVSTGRSNTVDALDLFQVYEQGKARGFKDKFGKSNLWLGTDRKANIKSTITGFGTEDGEESQVIGTKTVHEDGVNDKLLKYINAQTNGSYASLNAVPENIYNDLKIKVAEKEKVTRFPGLVGADANSGNYHTGDTFTDNLLNKEYERYMLRYQLANSNLIGDYVALGKRPDGKERLFVGENDNKDYRDAFVFSNDAQNAAVRFSQSQYFAPKTIHQNLEELLSAISNDNSISTKKANKNLKKPTTQNDIDSAEKIEARNKAAQQKRMKAFKLWQSLPENKGKTLADYDQFTQEQTKEQGTGRL